MKKKVIVIIVLLVCAAVLGCGLYLYNERKKDNKEFVLAIDYKHQNKMFPRIKGEVNEYKYMGYDAIDEPELYVRLTVYNKEHSGEEQLSIEEVKEYLSNEYNEDGTLRIYNGYEKIRDYENWYFEGRGCDDIEEYWMELGTIAMKYQSENIYFKGKDVREFSSIQLQELIKKEADPSYVIDDTVMESR